MAKKNKITDEKQSTFGNEDDFYIDPYGQMTINKIDSPIGLKCQELITAEMKVNDAKEAFENCANEFMKVMQEHGLKKITVLGKKVVYQEPKLSEAKVVIKGQDQQ
jgi:acetate kinase